MEQLPYLDGRSVFPHRSDHTFTLCALLYIRIRADCIPHILYMEGNTMDYLLRTGQDISVWGPPHLRQRGVDTLEDLLPAKERSRNLRPISSSLQILLPFIPPSDRELVIEGTMVYKSVHFPAEVDAFIGRVNLFCFGGICHLLGYGFVGGGCFKFLHYGEDEAGTDKTYYNQNSPETPYRNLAP